MSFNLILSGVAFWNLVRGGGGGYTVQEIFFIEVLYLVVSRLKGCEMENPFVSSAKEIWLRGCKCPLAPPGYATAQSNISLINISLIDT
jgi:hypothetical protein